MSTDCVTMVGGPVVAGGNSQPFTETKSLVARPLKLSGLKPV